VTHIDDYFLGDAQVALGILFYFVIHQPFFSFKQFLFLFLLFICAKF